MSDNNSRTITLGIDAGGTFTDLVLFDTTSKEVIDATKISTCHENMLKTLDEGIELILQNVDASSIKGVNLATTFATNAIVENRMRPVKLILIGYSGKDANEASKANRLGTGTVSVIGGGHSYNGEELAPLDEEALRAVINELSDDIEGIAISGYFSIRNPEHEIKASAIIKEMRPDIYVTSGHELTWELNAYRRAATASLNAGLIPIIIQLINSLTNILEKRGVIAPLTVVRGDGTAVGEAWAMLHPVEMLLSGPAASAVGAGFLAAKSKANCDSWICDIGGTTADIIALDGEGKPQISRSGACVGDHKTLIKSIDIFTFGQGGDSRVSVGKNDQIAIGPLRVKPLCVLASEYPCILEDLRRTSFDFLSNEPLFILPTKKREATDKHKLRLLSLIIDKPISIYSISRDPAFEYVTPSYVTGLAKEGYIDLAGFTPTDAFHVLGTFQRWDSHASVLGAKCLLTNKRDSAENFAAKVFDQMTRNIALAIFEKSIQSALLPSTIGAEITELFTKALKVDHKLHNMIKLQLNGTLIGAGAPAILLTNSVAKLLGSTALVAEKAEVAGAIGAAVGTFAFSGVILISRLSSGDLRVHHPFGISDFEELDDAVAEAEKIIRPWLGELAASGGVKNPIIKIDRRDVTAAGKMHLWTELNYSVNETL